MLKTPTFTLLTALAITIVLGCTAPTDPVESTVVTEPAPDSSASLADTPTPLPAEARVTGILTAEDLKSIFTIKDLWQAMPATEEVRELSLDYMVGEHALDSSELLGVESFYGLNYLTLDYTRGVLLRIMDTDSEETAVTQFEKIISETPNFIEMDPPIANRSVAVKINADGIGNRLAFQKGDKVVSLLTSRPDGDPPFITLDGLKRLAEKLERKIK